MGVSECLATARAREAHGEWAAKFRRGSEFCGVWRSSHGGEGFDRVWHWTNRRDQIEYAATSAAADGMSASRPVLSPFAVSVPRCARAVTLNIFLHKTSNSSIHLVSVPDTARVAPRPCPSTAGSPNHTWTSSFLPHFLPSQRLVAEYRSVHADVHRIMRVNLRSVRPNAVFNSFLGLLDIKLG
jgi:hypothetical protein